jgi:hypothetical protein
MFATGRNQGRKTGELSTKRRREAACTGRRKGEGE